MEPAPNQRPADSTRLQHIMREVSELLRKQHLVEQLLDRTDTPRHALEQQVLHRQHLSELERKLSRLHPADIAHILEALPLEERLTVWDLVRADLDGEILLEVSDAVRESLIARMDQAELQAAAAQLDADELADLAADLPRDVLQSVLDAMDAQNRARLQAALSYPEDTVGALMDYAPVTIREDISLDVVYRYLRRIGELPDHTDKLFVTNRHGQLTGILLLRRLVAEDPARRVSEVMARDVVTFSPGDPAEEAAQAFERYDLVSAPVVDERRHVLGRLTIDVVVDYLQELRNAEMLGRAGLREDEDLFAGVGPSVRNRWPWLAVNLVTALIASRVIGLFEGTIERLVALAALMPIVAGIGGNTGNQTSALIIRALALDQLNDNNTQRLIRKEIRVALLNGLVWGSVVGAVAYGLYGNPALGVVMSAAMLLNLLLAALAGMLIPLAMHRLRRDPALGSSVLLTATTDSGGFFIFLGLASVFLQ
ncbi:MAG: magnesium transporter [Pseudomonadota bacterium]|nr:magnesium transporter [Pseudomonadota bacterium]